MQIVTVYFFLSNLVAFYLFLLSDGYVLDFQYC